MGVQKASASIALECVPDLGTFRPYMLCDKGELWQNYTGDPSTTTTVVPDFTVAANQPVISAYLQSSRKAGFEIADEIYFYLGAAEIGHITRIGASYSKTLNPAWGGAFALLSPGENPAGVYGLKIVKNLVGLTGGTGGVIAVKHMVSEGASVSEFTDSMAFRISEMTTNGDKVVIEAGGANGFVITEKSEKVTLKAAYYSGTSKITTGVTYEWYRQQAGANPGDANLANWAKITTATTDTLIVGADDIDTSRLYMVIVKKDGSYAGQDTQIVYDKSDVYEVEIDANPPTKKVKAAGDTVELTCAVWVVGSNAPLSIKNDTWAWMANTPAGTPIVLTNTSVTNTLSVPYADIEGKASGALIVNIQVEFELA